MSQDEVLIIEDSSPLSSPDRALGVCPIPNPADVPPDDILVLNYSMQLRALVVKRVSSLLTETSLAGAELSEILGTVRTEVGAELESYATEVTTAGHEVEEDEGILRTGTTEGGLGEED